MPELHFDSYRSDSRYTHYLFRFPAKFHPPVVRRLLDIYSKPGDVVLDPFCGSGTLLVEAALMKRDAIGVDIDPVASFIATVKSRPIDPKSISSDFEGLLEQLEKIRRPKTEYEGLIHDDFDDSVVERFRDRYRIPAIPNIHHWFRNYVTLDLARLRKAIRSRQSKRELKEFYLACFASIIRAASNADPVPVSGLEVTAHMLRLEKKGRRIDPFSLFEAKVKSAIAGMGEFYEEVKQPRVRVVNGDVTALGAYVRSGTPNLILTSPPYNRSVDYYRRHTLEMFWLDFVKSQEERLKLRPKYIGHDKVARTKRSMAWKTSSDYVSALLRHAGEISPSRESAFRHYASSMQLALGKMAQVLSSGRRAIIVFGNAKWNGKKVVPTKLLRELAGDQFKVEDHLTYTSKNQYMSYDRHNSARVNREHVLVLKRV
jgi:hypothetical protein